MFVSKRVLKALINYVQVRHKTKCGFKFENRYRKEDNVCIVLAGYKEMLWDDVFGRIKAFSIENVHICIVSSGKRIERLSEIAAANNWSYISTKKNNLCLAQNIAINCFKEASGIFKLDEDIFITKEFFATLLETYEKALCDDRYDIGFVSCQTPLNGYCYINLLERFGRLEEYEKKFGKAKYSCGGSNDTFLMNKEVPLYIFGIKELLNIDKLSETLKKESFSYSICPIRFSIGAIYFKREVWEKMGMFNVPFGGVGLGIDERDLCAYCITSSKAIIVSNNCAVGHLGYGTHMSEKVYDFYYANREYFTDKENINEQL